MKVLHGHCSNVCPGKGGKFWSPLAPQQSGAILARARLVSGFEISARKSDRGRATASCETSISFPRRCLYRYSRILALHLGALCFLDRCTTLTVAPTQLYSEGGDSPLEILVKTASKRKSCTIFKVIQKTRSNT
jgi:hypothetical protein